MSGPYRVLLVSDAYAPMIGGADRAVRSVALELKARGHMVCVATAWQPGLPEHEVCDGVDVHRLRDLTSRVPWVSDDPNKHVPPPFADPEGMLRLRRLVKSFRPDLIHSYGWLTYSSAPRLAHGDVPLVLSVHDYGNFCALRTMLYMDREFCTGPGRRKCLGCARHHYGAAKGAVAVAGVLGSRRALARAASAVQCNSEFTRDTTWRHLLAGRTRIAERSRADVVIPPFPEATTEQEPDLSVLDRLPERYILFVGALRRVKGVGELLEAHARLDSPPPLVLAGTREIDTPEEFPPGVTVIESIPHSAVMAAWDRALFGVFPSVNPEPFGLVVLEAMSRGRATIGTSPGGHSEMIVHEENGLLVRPGDVADLASAMQRLVDDAALRDRLGAAAEQRAELFMADRWVGRLEDLYDEAVSA